MASIVFSVIVLSVLFSAVFGVENYCAKNTFAANGTYMQFTKEASVEEFAIAGKFKGLHCCAKGYRTIEWYKDGKAYPWPLMVSHLILYPESANQTVYAKAIAEADAGNYTCLLRNDTVVHSHTIHLKVFEKSPEDPKVTYVSPDEQVSLGHSLRLFCEAFAGRVDLPDARNEVVWRKSGHNSTLDTETRVRQEKTSREDGQTFGTYLLIDNIRTQDFGEYVCTISKPGRSIEHRILVQEKVDVEYINPNPIPVLKMLLCMSVTMFLVLAVLILNLRYGLPLRVHLKDRFGALEDDEKSSDVLILHSVQDSDLALGVLRPVLEERHQYKCSSRTFPSNVNQWFGELQSEALKSRRVVALMSPAVLDNQWDCASIFQGIKQLQALGPRFVCVMLKELPRLDNQVKNANGETLASLVRVGNVVVWERSNDERMWLALRLRLPPKRGPREERARAEGLPRLTSDSQQSYYV